MFPKELPGEDFINSWYPILIALAAGLIYGFRNYFKGPQCPSHENLKKKTVIVTGANAGIGKELVRDLVGRGARVILACRDEKKAKETVDEIIEVSKHKPNPDRFVVRKLDLASFKSIKEFAEKINKEEDRIDILFNNAGVICYPQEKTEDGNEFNLQVNYLGPFLLTHLLLDKLKATKHARIINNTALAYKLGQLDLDDLNFEKREFVASDAYAQSKLANVLFTRKFAKVIEGSGSDVTVNVCHPGVVNTDGLRHMPFKQNAFIRFSFAFPLWFLMKTSKDGAQTALHAGIAKEEAGVSGKYYSDCAMADYDNIAKDDEQADQLYEKSLEMTGLN